MKGKGRKIERMTETGNGRKEENKYGKSKERENKDGTIV